MTEPTEPALPVPGHTDTIVVVLTNGDSRETVLVNSNSYLCPWCETPVLSPGAWRDREQLRAEDRERDGEPVQPPQPYPADQRAAWYSGGCPNPACPVRMTAEQLAVLREREEAAADWKRNRETARQLSEERQRELDELWERLAGEAAEQDACLECLRRSSWASGKPKFTRHRIPDFHNPARVRG